MNAIETYNLVQFYVDRTRGARYYFSEINSAVNDAIKNTIDDITDTANANQTSGIDRLQVFRDELYTLIKTESSVPTVIGAYNTDVLVNHINYPTDYRTFVSMSCTIDGATSYVRDLTYNNKGPVLDDSFLKPTNSKVKFLEDSTGLKLYRGTTGTISNASLDYIKQPVAFNMGSEAQLIDPGVGVLNPLEYYVAVEDSVVGSTFYATGTKFINPSANLISGQVIPFNVLVPIELPIKTHADIAKRAAAILSGVVKNFESSGFAEKESM